jgi:hypothetical protein
MGVRRSLGYVPQQLSADGGLTGRENVTNFARLFDVPRSVRHEKVERALDAVGLLDVADRLTRDRLMGIGQAITMPLFFTSSALYPISVMPGWLQPISRINPLTYEVDGLRSLLIGTSTDLPLDLGVLLGSTVLGVVVASLLLPRLAKG